MSLWWVWLPVKIPTINDEALLISIDRAFLMWYDYIMKLNKTAYAEFRVGNHITDQELKELLKFFTDLEESLRGLGERFHLAWVAVLQDMMTLQSYDKARREK